MDQVFLPGRKGSCRSKGGRPRPPRLVLRVEPGADPCASSPRERPPSCSKTRDVSWFPCGITPSAWVTTCGIEGVRGRYQRAHHDALTIFEKIWKEEKYGRWLPFRQIACPLRRTSALHGRRRRPRATARSAARSRLRQLLKRWKDSLAGDGEGQCAYALHDLPPPKIIPTRAVDNRSGRRSTNRQVLASRQACEACGGRTPGSWAVRCW